MENFTIRRFQPKDLKAIKEITYRTGFKGEDLTGLNYIEDKELFFLIFIGYYPRYEPEHFLVAVETSTDDVVGFICGTPDTSNQQRKFLKVIIPRIVFRAIFYTSWRYPLTLINFLKMSGMRYRFEAELAVAIRNEYPAHLHINLLPEYQGRGLGTRLIQTFEEHLLKLGVTGIHLETTNFNRKAVPFYKKSGYNIIHESEKLPHPILGELKILVFTKRME